MEASMTNLTSAIDRSRPQSFLRVVLLGDAAASGATGLLVLIGGGFLEGLLGVPAALLRGAGLILLPYVAFVVYVGTRERLTRPAVWAVIICNALWTAASVLLLMGPWIAPTALGYAFVIGQALIVALLGGLQYLGLQRRLSL
jgi:hypothetical protein